MKSIRAKLKLVNKAREKKPVPFPSPSSLLVSLSQMKQDAQLEEIVCL